MDDGQRRRITDHYNGEIEKQGESIEEMKGPRFGVGDPITIQHSINGPTRRYIECVEGAVADMEQAIRELGSGSHA